ncbi:MAG: hypothetical protein HY446_01090, partial [Candidatus Niyogibacteria bacterium]|nr:hypothetical protein [Candidatus Niyogibacteria bacterium]
MPRDRRSFFERLTGSVPAEEEEKTFSFKNDSDRKAPLPEASDEGQPLVDDYQTPAALISQTLVSGVRPDDLDVTITPHMVT